MKSRVIVETAIDELFATTNKTKTASATQRKTLKGCVRCVPNVFAIVEELGRDELSSEEVDELLAELIDMKTEEE